jgi:hypothetical protein
VVDPGAWRVPMRVRSRGGAGAVGGRLVGAVRQVLQEGEGLQMGARAAQ